MKLGVPALIPLLPLLSACSISISTDDRSDETESSESGGSQGDVDGESTTTTDAESSSDSGSESASEATADSSSTDSGTDSDGDSTSTASETGSDSTQSGSETDSGTDSETGGIEEPPPGYCGMSAGPIDPWFEITQDDTPIGESGEFAIECHPEGGQFQFAFDAELGGFMPVDKLVQFHVIMDVPGFDVGPNGHFAEKDFEIFIGCCPEDYYQYPIECLYDPKPAILLPNAIMNPGVLDGLPATLTITMHSPEGDVEQVVDVDIWAMQGPSWEWCGIYDHQPLDIAMSIPIG
ncbi:hypothetical protein ACNOYE_30855 [Nannocystaceae bacterium ST9]